MGQRRRILPGGRPKPPEGGGGANEEEVWIRRADGEQAVRLRALNHFMAKGGVITEVRLIEREDAVWTIRVRLSGRTGDYIVNRFDTDAPWAYKDVSLAINTIYQDLRYRGAIIISTDRDYAAAIPEDLTNEQEK